MLPLPTSARRRGTGSRANFQRIVPLTVVGLLTVYGVWSVHTAATRAQRRAFAAGHRDDPASLEEMAPRDWTPAELVALPGADAAFGCLRGPAGASAAAGSLLAGAFGGSAGHAPELSLSAAGGGLDAAELSVTGWVHILPPDWPGATVSIQTIAATKASGCAADALHHGWAIFANEWGTSSEQLYLSWGNGASGCEELATPRGTLQHGRWTAIAATISPSGARLYIDGALQADSAAGLGKARIAAGAGGTLVRPLRPSEPVRVGAHADGTHPLRGYIAQLAIWPTVLTAEAVARLACLQPTEPLGAAVAGADAAATPANASAGVIAASLPPPLANLTFDETGARLSAASGARLSELLSERVPACPISRAGSGQRRAAARIADRYVPPARGVAVSYPLRAANPAWPLDWLPARQLHRGSPAEINASDAIARVRLEHVRRVFGRAWGAYRRYAFGRDELKPISNRSHEWLHLGATLVDCLDNLWLFGFKKEFDEAKEWVATKLTFSQARGISMFETVIRVLGGLLSAYELSRERVFLAKATELAELMMYAFHGNAHGVPCTTISLDGSRQCGFPQWTGGSAILAEYGTIQLEFKYLAHHTGQRRFWDVAEAPIRLLRGKSTPPGLYPTFLSPRTGAWSNHQVTMGALSDSFYEYLVKQWLLTGKREAYLRQMFDEAMVGMAKLMVQRSTPSSFVYVADLNGHGQLNHKMDHLACFVGAMLAVGAQDGGPLDTEYMTLADAIGETCYEMYRRTASGLSPEYTKFNVAGKDMDTPRNAAYNIGRPEAVETFFVMWYYTRDPKWREMGWQVNPRPLPPLIKSPSFTPHVGASPFLAFPSPHLQLPPLQSTARLLSPPPPLEWQVFTAFEAHAATQSGWASLPDVDNPGRKLDDKMESFVLAETMKYLFLLFDSDYPVPLEKYIFNTEAHPLGRIEMMGGGAAR